MWNNQVALTDTHWTQEAGGKLYDLQTVHQRAVTLG